MKKINLKKILTFFVLSSSLFVLSAHAVPSAEQTASVKSAVDAFVQANPYATVAQWREFGKAQDLSVLWESAKGNPAEFNAWKAQAFGAYAKRVGFALKGYRDFRDGDCSLTTELSACFGFVDWWKEETKLKFVADWEKIKANPTIAGVAVSEHMLVDIAGLAGDDDYILNIPEAIVKAYGLVLVLKHIDEVVARMDPTKLEDAKKAWNAYVRVRKIIFAEKDLPKNAPYFARLIASENSARYDYKCAKQDAEK